MLFSENLADHSGLRLLTEIFNYLDLGTLLKPDPDLEGKFNVNPSGYRYHLLHC
jgi:hypothetical protein